MAWQSLVGVLAIPAIAWMLSEDRTCRPWRLLLGGLALQFVLALVLLKISFVQTAFLGLTAVVDAVQKATQAGTSFVFGYVGGGKAPFAVSYPESAFVLGFQALPLILVVSAISALLFHWRILPAIVGVFAWALRRTLGIGGPVGVGAAANVFIGMVEAPLLIRPYLAKLSRSELFVVMVCGMATIAGTVMVLYATILAPVLPDAVGHILGASILNAPAAVTIARLMVPDAGPPTEGGMDVETPRAASAMEAITHGTTEGVKLLINVVAMLLVLVALVSLVNQALGVVPDVMGAPLTLERMLGWAMAPLAWLMGIPWAEAGQAGAILGVKVMLNELLAYVRLAEIGADALEPRSRLIMTYALCGFANFGSLGIMIGGLATMVPERRADVVGLGIKSLIGGTLATCLSGAIVGVIA